MPAGIIQGIVVRLVHVVVVARQEELIYLVGIQMWIQLLLLSKTITRTKSLRVPVAFDP